MADARRAADALVAAGVGEVWLYGSVARGEQHEGSDIDLVAVLDDLEYRRRLTVTQELRQVAREACGRWVEVLVTDQPEWRCQRERVPASFISAISCNLELLACSLIRNPVDWGKEQVMATSNDELAVERLRGVVLNLTKIDSGMQPGRVERALADHDDPGDYLEVRGGRLVDLCEAADMAVENAAKALAVLEDVEAETLWSHDVGKIVDELDADDADALRSLMAAASELVKSPDYITMWRTRGAYGSPTEGMTVQQVASPAFAQSMALIACDVAQYVADAAHSRLGEHEAAADVRRWATTIRSLVSGSDIITGKPLD